MCGICFGLDSFHSESSKSFWIIPEEGREAASVVFLCHVFVLQAQLGILHKEKRSKMCLTFESSSRALKTAVHSCVAAAPHRHSLCLHINNAELVSNSYIKEIRFLNGL